MAVKATEARKTDNAADKADGAAKNGNKDKASAADKAGFDKALKSASEKANASKAGGDKADKADGAGAGKKADKAATAAKGDNQTDKADGAGAGKKADKAATAAKGDNQTDKANGAGKAKPADKRSDKATAETARNGDKQAEKASGGGAAKAGDKATGGDGAKAGAGADAAQPAEGARRSAQGQANDSPQRNQPADNAANGQQNRNARSSNAHGETQQARGTQRSAQGQGSGDGQQNQNTQGDNANGGGQPAESARRPAQGQGNGQQNQSAQGNNGRGGDQQADGSRRSARGQGNGQQSANTQDNNPRQTAADGARVQEAVSRQAAGKPTQADLQLLRQRPDDANPAANHAAQQASDADGNMQAQRAEGGNTASSAGTGSSPDQPKPPVTDQQWSQIQEQSAENFANKAEGAPGDSPVSRWAELQHYKAMGEAEQSPVSGQIDMDKVNADIEQLKNNAPAMKEIRAASQESIAAATKAATGKNPTKLAEEYGTWMGSDAVKEYADSLAPEARRDFNARHTDRVMGLNSKVGVDTKRAIVQNELAKSPAEKARSVGEKGTTEGLVTLADAMLGRQQPGPQGEAGGPSNFDRGVLDARLGIETVDGLRAAWQALAPREQRAAMNQVANNDLLGDVELGEAMPNAMTEEQWGQFDPGDGATRAASDFAGDFVDTLKGAGLYRTAAYVAAGTALVKRFQSMGNGGVTPGTPFALVGDFMSLTGNLGVSVYDSLEAGARSLGFTEIARELSNEREPGGAGEAFMKGMGAMSSLSAAMYGFTSLGGSLADVVSGRGQQASAKAGLGGSLLGIAALGTLESVGSLTPTQRAWSGGGRAALGGLGRYFADQDFKLYHEGGGEAAGEGTVARRPVSEQMQAHRDQLQRLSGGANDNYLTDAGQQDLSTLNDYLEPGNSDYAAEAPRRNSFQYGDQRVTLTDRGPNYAMNVSDTAGDPQTREEIREDLEEEHPGVSFTFEPAGDARA